MMISSSSSSSLNFFLENEKWKSMTIHGNNIKEIDNRVSPIFISFGMEEIRENGFSWPNSSNEIRASWIFQVHIQRLSIIIIFVPYMVSGRIKFKPKRWAPEIIDEKGTIFIFDSRVNDQNHLLSIRMKFVNKGTSFIGWIVHGVKGPAAVTIHVTVLSCWFFFLSFFLSFFQKKKIFFSSSSSYPFFPFGKRWAQKVEENKLNSLLDIDPHGFKGDVSLAISTHHVLHSFEVFITPSALMESKSPIRHQIRAANQIKVLRNDLIGGGSLDFKVLIDDFLSDIYIKYIYKGKNWEKPWRNKNPAVLRSHDI